MLNPVIFLKRRTQDTAGSVFFLAFVCCIALATASPEPDRDPRMISLIEEAQNLVETKKPAAAIAKCDQIIAAFTRTYRNANERIYCGREPIERGAYLVKAVAENLKTGAEKHAATALSSTWADAYFVKAYALQELHRLPEAKATLKLALSLSPFNSHYLNELGEVYQLEKNWPKAQEQFKAAEDNASLAPHETKADDLARARRGLGYVFTELGNFDLAEKKYNECLAVNPRDATARSELAYIRGLRAKGKAKRR